MADTPDRVFAAALRQSIGAPARAEIDDQATVRLTEALAIVPRQPAVRLLTVANKAVPPDFRALLIGAEGIEAPGFIRFVPVGFIDSDAAPNWTSDDLLSSLQDTIERRNPDRLKLEQPEREARQWVQPPHYNRETHQLTWAALILPKNAPRDSDGEVTYHAIGFGRDGYVALTIVSSLQKAEAIGQMENDFLLGLAFRPGKTYGDTVSTDRRAPAGLAGAMEMDALHKARGGLGFLASDLMIPVISAMIAAIGALSLFVSIRRHLRREARRG